MANQRRMIGAEGGKANARPRIDHADGVKHQHPKQHLRDRIRELHHRVGNS
jgi:hypothetical protein